MTVLLDDLGLERFDLLGHSMGGIVSMRYVLAHPERVRSLVLMDTAAGTAVDNADMMRSGDRAGRTQGTAALYDLLQGFLGEGEIADAQRVAMKTKLGQMDPVAFHGAR